MMFENTPPYPPRGRFYRLYDVDWPIDLAIAFALALVGAALGYNIITNAQSLFFYQSQTPEIVYAACGHGYRHPGELSGPIIDFVQLRTLEFDCANLEGLETLSPPTLFATMQMYLGRTIAFLWHGPKLSYTELWPLTALAYGFYAAGMFVLLRLFYSTVPAALGGLLLTLSPIALSLLFSFRDFSKAPFAIWAIVLLLLTIRARNPWAGLGWAAATGVVTGIGAGFRFDLLVLLGVMVISLLAVWGFRAFFQRLTRAAVMVATFAVIAQPVFNVPYTGGNGTVISQGLTEPFRRFLGMELASYNLGHTYSDELTLSSVAAVERPLTPDWDANESQGYYDVSQVMKVSLPHVLDWLPYFAADFATQGLKSAVWITAMPSITASDRDASDPGGLVRNQSGPSSWLGAFHDFVGQPWLVALTIPGLFLFFWREAALRPQQVASTFLLFAGLLAMPVAQFSLRHIFHLEFIWVLALIAWVASYRDRQAMLKVTPWFWRSAGGLGAAGIVTYAALIVYQNQALPAAFADLLALPREPVAVLQSTRDDEGQLVGTFDIPVPPDHRDIVAAKADSLTDKLPVRGLAWDVRAEADRLFLTLQDCAPGTYAVRAVYETRPGMWQKLDYETEVEIGNAGMGATHVLLPAFYRPTQNLARIVVQPFPESCLALLERAKGSTPLPPHIVAHFPPNWQSHWTRRGFGGFGKPPIR